MCKYLKTFESFYQRWGLPPHWVCLPNVEPKALLLPHGPGPLLQETFEQILINRFIKAINIQSKCSNIRMLILEDGGEFDDLTQLCWRLERLLPKGSPGDGVPYCPKNPFKWPRKRKWWPSDSSPPPRISFIPFREQNSFTCCLGTVNHPFLDLSSCGLQKKKWDWGMEGGWEEIKTRFPIAAPILYSLKCRERIKSYQKIFRLITIVNQISGTFWKMGGWRAKRTAITLFWT